ncbi:MAG: Gfo/Idh/MocA family oxidoreductase [Candidatus Coatesbacteria bacterium]
MATLDFHGRVTDAKRVRIGFIGCGSHSLRNIYASLQYLPVELVATCDLDGKKAEAFARQFGAPASYTDYRAMLEKEKPEAVLVVTGYDPKGRPLYPPIACDCLERGAHVWMEKPPADTTADVDRMRAAAQAAGRHAMVGFKKMFVPANVKARELAADPAFGQVGIATFQYPMGVPTVDEIARYRAGDPGGRGVVGFLDHMCHPVSAMLYLLGWPRTLTYYRSSTGAGTATFEFPGGSLATITFAHGAGWNGGMERTQLVGTNGRTIVVENNMRLEMRRDPRLGYGDTPSFYAGNAGEVTSVWEPEFSLGQLYNKGLFLQGYWGELDEFARSILEGRAPNRAGLDHAWQATRIFEAFAAGPGHPIDL